MTPDRLCDIRSELQTSGYVVLRGAGTHSLVELLESLGRILHVEEVVVDPASGSLVKSPHGLSLHTDHHRADVIVWYCIAQSDDGGTTVLADGIRAYRTLSVEMREALRDVSLQEHSVFRGDQERHPVISVRNGIERLYYSYWLADDKLAGSARAAFDAFETAVGAALKIKVRLQPGDVLAIDNGRMLHGRTAIGGSLRRHLRRYWVEVGD